MPVLHLRGSPYEMGYQHGSLLRREVRDSVENILAFADSHLTMPGLGRIIVRRKLDRTWRMMKPHVPERYLEEMQGLADGAGIPLQLIQRVHALPDLTAVACANAVVKGAAVKNGRLIHIRNLDWAIHSNVHRYAALIVHEPDGKKPFLNIGWLGFVGVLSGISKDGISVGQIGAETIETGLKGTPMPFLLRRVLEESDRLDQAVKIIETGPRTVGYNYLIADAKTKNAVALETTRKRCAVFWLGKEPHHPDALRVENGILRSDLAMDPLVRDLQLACFGNPHRLGKESPGGSSAYEVRYRGQALLLNQFYGKIDPEIAMAIGAAIAPSSNIQSVVYAYPQVWVATAFRRRPAAQGAYQQVDLEELFGR